MSTESPQDPLALLLELRPLCAEMRLGQILAALEVLGQDLVGSSFLAIEDEELAGVIERFRTEMVLERERRQHVEPRSFRTLRGFLSGDEPDEPTYFAHCATLRIHGDNLPFEEITAQLGVQPTSARRKGERRGPRSPAYRDDAWHFQPALPESEPLEHHIEALWDVVEPHVEYLKSLKQWHKVDVFCGYRSNCDHAGIEVPHTCLRLFAALEVPFGVSIIIA